MQEDRVSFFHQSIYFQFVFGYMEGITSNYSSDIAWYVQTNLCEIFVVEIVW